MVVLKRGRSRSNIPLIVQRPCKSASSQTSMKGRESSSYCTVDNPVSATVKGRLSVSAYSSARLVPFWECWYGLDLTW